MAYEKIGWKNAPSKETPINDENLNHMDVGIFNNDVAINGLLNNIQELKEAIFPIGRGFIDFTNTDYSNYLGFKWERELVGMTAVGLDVSQTEFNTIGKTGGEKKHQLTVDEMPSHSHELYLIGSSEPSNAGRLNYQTGKQQRFGGTVLPTGGSQPHNILQPYKVVAYWKRVA